MRIIHYIDVRGNEYLYFTEDNAADAKEFVPTGCTIESDIEVDANFPSTFPAESAFLKQ
jgi:hypothetical protein